uniref:Ig-like domain-containing protein n=1 Tax=Cyprinus carpio TaxID=7962 RepID=A0A8C1R3R1_CYPCA
MVNILVILIEILLILFLTDLLTWCQVAEILTNQITDLGQSVTINCGLDLKEVTWFVLNLPDPPVLILRSFSNPPATFYFNNRFRQKYSVQPKHNLFINNVSIDELGVYYCTNIDRTAQFSNSTRLDWTTRILGDFFFFVTSNVIHESHQSILLFYFYFFHNFSLFSVSLQETVEGFIGGSAVLPCSSEKPPITIQDITVRWRNKYDKIVYEIIDGQVSVEEQDQQYKNRVESFPEEYKRGDFSIKLYNLQHTDAGLYGCYIFMKKESVVFRSVELLIKEKQIPSEGTKPRPEMTVMIISILFIGIISSLAVSSFISHNKHVLHIVIK